jgi:hypothetical protein
LKAGAPIGPGFNAKIPAVTHFGASIAQKEPRGRTSMIACDAIFRGFESDAQRRNRVQDAVSLVPIQNQPKTTPTYPTKLSPGLLS